MMLLVASVKNRPPSCLTFANVIVGGRIEPNDAIFPVERAPKCEEPFQNLIGGNEGRSQGRVINKQRQNHYGNGVSRESAPAAPHDRNPPGVSTGLRAAPSLDEDLGFFEELVLANQLVGTLEQFHFQH